MPPPYLRGSMPLQVHVAIYMLEGEGAEAGENISHLSGPVRLDYVWFLGLFLDRSDRIDRWYFEKEPKNQ